MKAPGRGAGLSRFLRRCAARLGMAESGVVEFVRVQKGPLGRYVMYQYRQASPWRYTKDQTQKRPHVNIHNQDLRTCHEQFLKGCF